MKCELRVVFLVASLACGLASASADDSFLNRELPTTWVCYQTPQDLLQVLRSVLPKTLVLPEGMSVPDEMPAKKPLTNPTEAEKTRAGSGALFGRVPSDKTPFTIRDYLNQAVRFMGMTWSYDAVRDAVVLDFPWHVNDPRSNAELMETLGKTIPPEDEKHVWSNTVDPKADPWRAAFNGLASKPENFPKAWQMRWKGDALADPGLPPGSVQPINLFTGKILDETGAAHFIILNLHPPSSIPGDSTISFYLLSETGKFEQGGIFYAEDRWLEEPSAKLAADQKRMFIHSGTNPSYNQYDQVFAIEKGRFVFKGHLTNGKSTTPYNPFKYLLESDAD